MAEQNLEEKETKTADLMKISYQFQFSTPLIGVLSVGNDELNGLDKERNVIKWISKPVHNLKIDNDS